MIPLIGVTQETMQNIDPNDTMIPVDKIRAINRTALDRIIDSRDTNCGARADSETTHASVITAHAHKVVFALEKYVHDGITNIHVRTNPYTISHVLDAAAHNILLQIENVLHQLNRSRRARKALTFLHIKSKQWLNYTAKGSCLA